MDDEKTLDERIEEARRALLDEYSKVNPGSEDAAKILTDLKDLTDVAETQQKIVDEQKKTENDQKNRKWDRIKDLTLSIGSGLVKLFIGVAVPIYIAVKHDQFLSEKLDQAFEFEANGNYPASKVTQGLLGNIIRK